ncbi:hypothetical protein T484DRAFT_1822397 [Baffinella frigidus]|nr:hypothetical protein T484DRAFT_1822397 [Cryptophyta sp. CCMP2293]
MGSLSEMLLLCNEAAARRIERFGLPKEKCSDGTQTKPLGLEYMADRLDTDDPITGYQVRSQAEGWLQGFITTTTFTVWQRNFRWDSHAPESGMAEDDLTERKWDKDNSLSMELEAQDRSGNPDAEVLPCHHLPHPPTPSIFPPPRNDVRGSSESLGRSGGGSTGDTTTRMFAECMCAEEVIDSHAHARGAPAGSPVCGGAWPTVVKSSMLMGWLTRQGIIFPNVAELSLLGGLGCGTRLVNLLIEQLEAGGKHDFLIVQATDNSVAFYETFGFVRVGAVALYRGRVDEGPLGWGCSTLPTWIRNKRVRFTVGSAGASAGTAAAASGGAAAGGVAGGGGGDSSATPGGAGDDSRGAFSIVVDQEWGASRGFRLVQMQILKDGTERVREWRCAGELEPFDAGGLPFVADRLWAQPLEPNKTLPVQKQMVEYVQIIDEQQEVTQAYTNLHTTDSMPTTLPSMPNTSLPSVDNAVLAPSPSGHANGHYGEHAGGGGAGAEGAGNGHDAGAGAGDAWGGAAQPRAKAEEEEVKMVVGAGLEPGSGPGPGQKAHSPAKAAQKGGKKRSSDKAGSKRKKGKGTLLQPPGPDVNWNDHSACTVALRRAQGFVPYCHWTFPTQSVEDIHPSYMMAKRIARGRHPPAGEGQAAELGSRLTTRLPPVKVTQPLDDLPRPLPYDDDMTPEQIKEKSMVNRVVTVPRSAHPERYYYVLHYIIDMDWCHLVPLQPTGVFTGTSFRAGRPRHPPRPSSSGDERYKLVPEGKARELNVPASRCVTMTAYTVSKTNDADREVWDIVLPEEVDGYVAQMAAERRDQRLRKNGGHSASSLQSASSMSSSSPNTANRPAGSEAGDGGAGDAAAGDAASECESLSTTGGGASRIVSWEAGASRVMKRLWKHKHAWPFCERVDPVVRAEDPRLL